MGGGFDPPTNIHFKIAIHIIKNKYADECWLVPCGPRSDKPFLITPGKFRKEMLEIYIKKELDKALHK